MRAITIYGAVAVTLVLVGLCAVGQELVPTPDTIGGAKINSAATAGSSPPAGATAKTDWRYRWYNGRWWYWTPQNCWMWYSNDGRWVAFDANNPPVPGYWAGYYPGVNVGVGPYGNVGVGVGRRIGVDVSGPRLGAHQQYRRLVSEEDLCPSVVS